MQQRGFTIRSKDMKWILLPVLILALIKKLGGGEEAGRKKIGKDFCTLHGEGLSHTVEA